MIEVELLPLTLITESKSDINASQVIHVKHSLHETSCYYHINDDDNELSEELELKSKLHLIAVHCGAKLAFACRNNNIINKHNNKYLQRHSFSSHDQHCICMYDGFVCSATGVSRTNYSNDVTNNYKNNNTTPNNTTSEKNNVCNDDDYEGTENNKEYNCYYYYYLLEGEYLAVFTFHQGPFAHIAPSLHSMLMLYIMYTSCLKGCSHNLYRKHTNYNSCNVDGLNCSLKEKMQHYRKELTRLLHWAVHKLCSALQTIAQSAQLAKLLTQLCENQICGKMYSSSAKMSNLLHNLFVNVLPEPMRQLPSCIFTSPVPITAKERTKNNTTRNNENINEFNVSSSLSSLLLDSSARYVLVAMAVWYDGQCLCHTAHDNPLHMPDNTFYHKNTNYDVNSEIKEVDYSNLLQLVALHAFMSSCQNQEEELSEHDKFHDSNTIKNLSLSSSLHHVMLSLFDHFMINESSPVKNNTNVSKETTEGKTNMMQRGADGGNVEHIGLGFHSTSTHWTASVILHSTQHLSPTSYFLGHLLPVWMEHFTHIIKYILPSPRLYSYLSQLEYLPRSHSYNIVYNKSMNALLTSPPFTSCTSLQHIAKHEQFIQLYIIRHNVGDHSECIIHSWTRQVQQHQQSHQRSKSVSVAHSSLVTDTQQAQYNRNQNKSLSISASLSQTQEQISKRALQRSSSAPSRSSANLTSTTSLTNSVLINSSLYTEYDAQVHARHKLRHRFTHLISSSAFMCANNSDSNEYFTSHGIFSMVRDNHALLLFHAIAPPSASILSSTSLSQHNYNNLNYFYYLIAEIEMDLSNSKDSKNVSATEMYNFAHWLLCRACFSLEHEVYATETYLNYVLSS